MNQIYQQPNIPVTRDPQPLDYARQAAAMRSYVTPAVVTLALYFLFWVPGVVTNVVYLLSANEDRRVSGVTPQGRGCLFALFALFVVLPALALVLMFGGSIVLGIIGASRST